MSVFLEVENLIAGKSPLKVEVASAQFGVGRSISTPTGTSSNRESAAPSISEIVVTRLSDKYSPLFYQEALMGNARMMTLFFVDGNATTVKTYLTAKMHNAMISGYSVSSGGDRPMESLSINFTKIEYKYDPIDKR